MDEPIPVRPFDVVEHTADLAFVARGRTPAELCENAAAAMISFLYDASRVEPRDEERIEAQGEDREELLIAFLQELLYRHEVHRRLFSTIRVESADPPSLVAIARGEPLDPNRHEILTGIKAATYHDLAIREERGPGGTIWSVRVVLDV